MMTRQELSLTSGEKRLSIRGSRKAAAIQCISVIITMIAFIDAIGAEMTNKTVNLPKTIGAWIRPNGARIIDSNHIFEYMNGAGELYLAYGFDHLKVCEYTSEQQDGILVEVYFMNTSNDAFGLLSLDWGGEPVAIHDTTSFPSDPRVSPPVRALYGGGLLRMWADTLYARVMAYRETTESKESVLSLGRTIGAGRKVTREPALLKIFPEAVEPNWRLKKDRIAYFRSHLVLNSLYYISHKNILQLDHTTEAVTAPYEYLLDGGAPKRVQVLLVKYANGSRARMALSHFQNAYLQDQKEEFSPNTPKEGGRFFNIEDGWLGCIRDGRYLAIVFECPDLKSAQWILAHMSYHAISKENQHEE